MDVCIGDGDQYEAVERLTRSAKEKGDFTLLLIPAGAAWALDWSRRLNVDLCVVKPFRPDEIRRAIENKLRGKVHDAPNLGACATRGEERRLTILVADDSPFNRMIASGLLKLKEHHVLLAENGREAFEIVKRGGVDIVFMDLEMPEMDGLEATRAIRDWEHEQGKKTPIVGLSAHALNEFRDKCLDSGMDSYITKPIQTEQLYEALQLVKSSPASKVNPAESPRQLSNT